MIDFDILDVVADIGNTKRLSVVRWGDHDPKLDLRGWKIKTDGTTIPKKGLTLTDEEAKNLYDALGKYIRNERACGGAQ